MECSRCIPQNMQRASSFLNGCILYGMGGNAIQYTLIRKYSIFMYFNCSNFIFPLLAVQRVRSNKNNNLYSSSIYLLTKFVFHLFFLSFFLFVLLFCSRARKDLLVRWEEMDRKDNEGRKECQEHVTYR